MPQVTKHLSGTICTNCCQHCWFPESQTDTQYIQNIIPLSQINTAGIKINHQTPVKITTKKLLTDDRDRDGKDRFRSIKLLEIHAPPRAGKHRRRTDESHPMQMLRRLCSNGRIKTTSTLNLC